MSGHSNAPISPCPSCGAEWTRTEIMGAARRGGGYWLRCHACGHEWGDVYASHGERETARRRMAKAAQTDYYDAEWGKWVPAAPLPYYEQRQPSLLARILVLTVFRRDRCRAKWWCSWPATERGGTCDPHRASGS